MKLPRDLSGYDLARLLARYGYGIVRQTGSHIRLTANIKGKEHHITIPAHRILSIGTLHAILAEVARHLEMTLEELVRELFSN